MGFTNSEASSVGEEEDLADDSEPSSAGEQVEHVVGPKKQLFYAGAAVPDVIPPDEPEDTRQGYSIVWDNVGKLVTRSHQSETNKNIYAVFANCLIVKNRVDFNDMESLAHVKRLATSIHLSMFVPGKIEFDALRQRMVVLTERVLVTYMPNLHAYHDLITMHIPHPHSEESKNKSEIVNIFCLKLKKIYSIIYLYYNINTKEMEVLMGV